MIIVCMQRNLTNKFYCVSFQETLLLLFEIFYNCCFMLTHTGINKYHHIIYCIKSIFKTRTDLNDDAIFKSSIFCINIRVYIWSKK